jgi:replicative DNA helicase
MSKEYNRYQEGLIKSILARPEEIANVVDYIDSRDFDNINFKLVYEAILELHLEKKPISLPGITLKIGELGGAIDTGWIFNLDNNIAQWVQAAPPQTWARLLKKESARHRAKNILQQGLSEINERKKDPLNLMDKIANELSQVSIDATSDEDIIDEFEE